MLELPPTFSQFLTFIGTPVFAAWIVSHFIETIPAWATLTATVKQLILAAIYIVLGLLSFGLVHWVPASVAEQLQPIYAIIVAAIGAWLSGMFYHGVIAPTGKAYAVRRKADVAVHQVRLEAANRVVEPVAVSPTTIPAAG